MSSIPTAFRTRLSATAIRRRSQTDVTVQSGKPIANSTFTLNGLVYAYTEDSAHNLLTITGTKSYMIAQPELTFKLDSSLLFTLAIAAPAANTYLGTVVPIGTVSSGSTILNVYAGTPESGMADFFTFKNVLYTFVKSGSTYLAVQKSYTVYVSRPAANQQQLAVFDMNGMTYIVTDGNTAGVGASTGINPGSMWSATSLNTTESQLGLVYGLAAQPTNAQCRPERIGHLPVPGNRSLRQRHDLRHHLHGGRDQQRGGSRYAEAAAEFHADCLLHLPAALCSADL